MSHLIGGLFTIYNLVKEVDIMGFRFRKSFKILPGVRINLVDVLPIAKARGFWDTDEPCYQMTVLRVLSAMDNDGQRPAHIYRLTRVENSLALFLYIYSGV